MVSVHTGPTPGWPASPALARVFLASPSKTADIEQSLVSGAPGARSLTVLLPG